MVPAPPPLDFIPHHRGGVVLLLESVGWNLGFLSVEQIAAVRQLYFLDSDKTIEEMVRSGEVPS